MHGNNISCGEEDCHPLILSRYQTDGDQLGMSLQGGSFQFIVKGRLHKTTSYSPLHVFKLMLDHRVGP